MEYRIMKLYKELYFLLNNSPVEDDCSDEQNRMYSDMANFKRKHREGFVLYVSVNKGLEKPLQNILWYGQYG